MRSRSSSTTSTPASRVVQACFPARRIPSGTAVQRFARVTLPPHPAAAQPRAAATHPDIPPHPATVAQPRGTAAIAPRPPHPATVAQPRPAFGAARAAQRKEADVHAFQTPEGFLEKSGPGQPLPSSVKLRMERYFGADFSDVRVHVGNEAASIGALAFTLGSDIYFAPEQYQPSTRYGQELLGHELTHVLQQREGRVANPYGDGVAVVQDVELEAEADRHGKAVAEGNPGPGSAAPPFGGGPGSQGGGAPGGIQGKVGTAQSKNGYKLVVGAYMHEGRLPEALAGHSFVAIEEPSGERHAFGFSPAHYGSYDPNRDLGRLQVGVEGVVHDDAGAFDKPGVKMQSYAITQEQARAAMAKVGEYKAGKHRYSADRQQCSTFALDVMKAARVPVPAGGAAPRPRVMYEALEATVQGRRGTRG
ncbi:DUF4157 domain-containing protein [Sorangium sp. So ce327]|uniref:eCIS core domain-containing protein n=1 Tax=Sorangium sp. So ce327 TaxID=3133301 RepID=UPI003F5FA349